MLQLAANKEQPVKKQCALYENAKAENFRFTTKPLDKGTSITDKLLNFSSMHMRVLENFCNRKNIRTFLCDVKNNPYIPFIALARL